MGIEKRNPNVVLFIKKKKFEISLLPSLFFGLNFVVHPVFVALIGNQGVNF